MINLGNRRISNNLDSVILAEFFVFGGQTMNDEKIIIPAKKYRGETSVVSARLSGDLIKSIDYVAKESGRTRNEVIQMCLEFAIERIEIKE